MAGTIKSLWTLSQETIVLHADGLQQVLHTLPPSLLVDIFVKAAQGLNAKASPEVCGGLERLVSLWPRDSLNIQQLFPEGSLTGAAEQDLGQVVARGLLRLNPDSPLSTVKLTASTSYAAFLLPVVYLVTMEGYTHKQILDRVKESWELRVGGGEEELYCGLESVLAWHLEILLLDSHKYTVTKHKAIDVWCDWEISLGDWMALKEAICALILQPHSPFVLHISALKVYNYQTCDVPSLKWLLSLTELKDIRRLSIFGRKRRSDLVMFEMYEELLAFSSLTLFHLGFLKKNIMVPLRRDSDPHPEDVLEKTKAILESWKSLKMMHFLGARLLSGTLRAWLSPLQSPLTMLYLNYCHLTPEDLEYLADSHHLPALTELGLEGNECRGQGHLIMQIAAAAPRLQLLNLRETQLKLHEKVEVVVTLASCAANLNTLAMYEQEDMLSVEGYTQLLQAACLLPKLTKFYVFPFDYKPFEIFFRDIVLEECEQILKDSHKEHTLKLFY